MPRSHNNIKRPKPSSEAVKAAAEKVLSGQSGLREAALEYNVSKSTLSRHLIKHRNEDNEEFLYVPNNAIKQVFTKAQEGELNVYLKQCSNMHYGLSTVEVRKLAYNYARVNGIKYPDSWDLNQKSGVDWLKYFLKRNNDLSLRKPQATSLARSTAFNKENVNTFFDKLENVIKRFNFGPENIYNLDETGMSTVHAPVRILAPKGKKQVGSMTSGERGLNITMIGAINAVGNSIPPLFVFPRVHFKDHMLKGAPIGSVGVANQSGWSNSAIFLEYLHHFVKYTHSSQENKILLILDNHESHISVEILNFSKEHGIVMLTLPPHTSHKLQPLDRSVFGRLKKYYNTACNEWLLSNSGKPMTLYDVAECVGKAFPKAFSPANIQSGFRVAGVFPLNRNIFEEHEFLSSFVTDRPLEQSTRNFPLATKDLSENDESSANSVIDSQPVPGPSGITITPDKIRPFPKAQARKGVKRGGRKLGRCRILTDTPEKTEIEEEAAMRERKNKCKKTTVKKILVSSSSSSSDKENQSISSSDSLEDIEWDKPESEDEMSNDEIKVGGFVLVKLMGKKSIKFYVAKVIEMLPDDVLAVKYLKKLVGGKFIFHDETVYEISTSEVVMILPLPQLAGGTERRSHQMRFSVDFSGYNIE